MTFAKEGTFTGCAAIFLALAVYCMTPAAVAQQVDIPGPVGSCNFGSTVTVLPNSNIVVTDPCWSSPSAQYVGAAYLYSPTGNLISTLTGSVEYDNVGFGGVVVLTNGNYVIRSQRWNNGSTTMAGAVTWASGVSGVSGVVSAANSLTSAQMVYPFQDTYIVVPLKNGNYVVANPDWSSDDVASVGAVTWGNGNIGTSGLISAQNSLVGTQQNDQVGTGFQYGDSPIVALANGNYVVISTHWRNGAAATWGNGNGGTVGAVSIENSLVGLSLPYGSIVGLSNGNYVVVSPEWRTEANAGVGAVTWCDGNGGRSGVISATNSLVGSSAQDHVGGVVTALSNGNYVVGSRTWHDSTASAVGAVTWVDGSGPGTGVVSASNSFVGTTAGDGVGNIVALSNGNYVIGSPGWDNDAIVNAGAVTWMDGSVGSHGTISPENSLVGTVADNYVGSKITALDNGNYVVSSPYWDDGATTDVGAVTWMDGNASHAGEVSEANSLIGTTGSVVPLSNGNYVIYSWNNGAGAATWADGTASIVGTVSAENSLIGVSRVTPLLNGNYVVSMMPSYVNSDPAATGWVDGRVGRVGVMPASALLQGAASEVRALTGGHYLVVGPILDIPTISLGRGSGGTVGPVPGPNSLVFPGHAPIPEMYSYDAARDTLVVGQPESNIVTLFKVDLLFANGLE